MSTWINVSEQLPPNMRDVLVYEKGSEVPFVGRCNPRYWGEGRPKWFVDKTFLSYDEEEADMEDFINQEDITHWMPIPQLPTNK